MASQGHSEFQQNFVDYRASKLLCCASWMLVHVQWIADLYRNITKIPGKKLEYIIDVI